MSLAESPRPRPNWTSCRTFKSPALKYTYASHAQPALPKIPRGLTKISHNPCRSARVQQNQMQDPHYKYGVVSM
ncbi:unnamed protein product [Prunus brigantina]